MKIILYFLLVINLAGIKDLQAQRIFLPEKSDPLSESWRWRNFPQLSTLGVECLTSDKNGNTWFGYLGGIAKYDKYIFKYYPLPDSVSTQAVIDILCLHDSVLISTNEYCYLFTNTNDWKPFKLPAGIKPYNYFDLLTQTKDHSIWIACEQGALRYINGNFILYRDQSFHHFKAGVWIPGLPKEDKPMISQIYEDGNNIWFFQMNRNYMVRINNWQKNIDHPSHWEKINTYSTNADIHINKNDDGYWLINNDPNQGVLFSAEGYNFKEVVNFSAIGGENFSTSIISTPTDGQILVAGQSRLYAKNKGNWQMYALEKLGLVEGQYRIFTYNQKYLWVLCYSSEVYLLDLGDYHFSTWKDLHFQCEDNLGKQWFLHKNRGVVCYDKNLEQWIIWQDVEGLIDMPMSIKAFHDGDIIVSGSNDQKAAVSIYCKGSWIMITPQNMIEWFSYNSLEIVHGKKEAWVGAGWFNEKNKLGGLVHIYQGDNKWQHEIIRINDHMSSRAASLAIKDHEIWFGGATLSKYPIEKKFDPGFPTVFFRPWISDLLITREHEIWISKKGMGIFKSETDGSWKNFTTVEGLAGNTVSYLLEAKDSTVWAATGNGISRYDGNSWFTMALPKQISIPKESGTMAQDNDGAIWINIASRSWYFPFEYDEYFSQGSYTDDFYSIKYIPSDHQPVTHINYYRKKVSTQDDVHISWSATDYLNQTPSEYLQFSHQLDHEHWSSFSDSTSINITSLTRGIHIFRVKARNASGIESDPVTVSFHAMPPLWQQYWFVVMMVILISGLILLAIKILINNNRYKLLAAKMEKRAVQLQQANEEIEELSAFRQRFFTNMSHELKTPLTLIRNPLRSISTSNELPETLKQKLLMSLRHADRLKILIDQLLMMRHWESRGFQLNVEYFELKPWFEKVTFPFYLTADEKNINFEVHLENLFGNGYFDKSCLETILYNLLHNAFKFTPMGGHVAVKAQLNNDIGHCTLLIEIIDNGPGIPNKDKQKIFERYFQVNIDKAGSGIGLELVKEMIDSHQGNITVNDGKYGGTVFQVVLPSLDALMDNSIIKSEKGVVIKKELKFNNAKVVLLEDEPDLLEYLKQLLSPYLKVIARNKPDSFVQFIEKEMPDMVICDIMLDAANGRDLCEAIKTNPITSHIPVILLTAISTEEAILEGYQARADAYITKPFNDHELLVRINNLLEFRKNIQQKFGAGTISRPDEITSQVADQELIKEVFNLLDQNISNEDFTIYELSKEIGIGQGQLSAKLKSLCGYTPKELLLQKRLQKARELLKTGGKNVAEVCYTVGFSNPKHFSRSFKARFGIAPSEVNQNKIPN